MTENRTYTPLEVDLVYLWCDGSDPSFAARKAARIAAFGHVLTEDNAGDVRYVQHDELRYSLRSAFENVPWIRHIFIVTDGQRPVWLKDHPKISVVDHRQIIPAERLPLFSSIAIEMYLDRIPGLSEHFLYANDDMFFNRPLEVSDFYDYDRCPLVWASREQEKEMTRQVAADILDDDDRRDWLKTVVRAWMLYRKKRGLEIPFYTPAHSIDAYTKTFFRQTREDYPELEEANSAPFRTGNEISRVLFSYEMINTYECPVRFTGRVNFSARLRNRFFPVEMLTVMRDNVRKLKRDLGIFHPKTFCFNNITAGNATESERLLQERFPRAAPWEK